MNLDENVGRAFEVVRKTYENVDKLLASLDRESIDGGYRASREGFLRYNSDINTDGWLFNDFVKIYKNEEDELLESNDWYDRPIYIVDICFYGSPKIKLGKFHYEDIKQWSPGISPGSAWQFTNVMNKYFYNEIFEYKENDDCILVRPKNKEISKKYWGLVYCEYKDFNLSEIRDDSGVKMLISTLDYLRRRDLEDSNID